ncbi:unnamed protein product [Caenorhabditis auriculariae]|uniref:Nose resistant-to-fluoxetine protein N-terminal domain-containing protein n=1 Tax=Caenorhabditis auriculariae TaxID=2777116 RepID=A0A8S1H3C8_9PELO|nr:unnamed protein product [Caenorhabditis auriculariae]
MPSFLPSSLFLFLIFVSVGADKLPFENPFLLKSANLSPQCQNDTDKYSTSLKAFVTTETECLITQNCTTQQKKILKDNLYALKQYDASGHFPAPGEFEYRVIIEGSSAGCYAAGKSAPYDTKYCYIRLAIGKNATCIAPPIRQAICVPVSCGKTDIAAIYNANPNRIFTACTALCPREPPPKNTAFWVYTGFLIAMTVIVMTASVVDYLRETLHGVKSAKETNYLLRLLSSFSIYTNAELLLSVKEPKEGHIRSLDCIRFFSMSWVVSGHVIGDFIMSDTFSPLFKLRKDWINETFINAFVSVDTFFVLSGVVVAYLFFKNAPKRKVITNPITWIMFYVHRYLRLTPPIMLFIGFFVVYGDYIYGPWTASSFNQITPQVQACSKYWWRNLIYINNFNMNDQCYGPSWYLAVDTQLYVIIPIFLIALYFSAVVGVVAIVAACAGSVVTCYILMIQNDLPTHPLGPDPQQKFMPYIYVKPWIRCPPYFIGILTGYFLAKVGNRRIRAPWILIVIGWISAGVLGSACIYSIQGYTSGADHWSKFVRATYYNFHRIGWSLAVSWVIIANHLGWGGPINNFMSHPIWQPFGRLSYCAYIVHWMVIYYFFNLMDGSMHFVSLWQTYLYFVIPVTLMAYFCAFFWSCYFEVPTLKLEKMLIEAIMKKLGAMPAKTSDKLAVETSNQEKKGNNWDIPNEQPNLVEKL